MIFAGFQSVSLLDFPGVVASIVFTQGCPFRCVYCHNPELIPVGTPADGGIPEEEVLARLLARRKMVDGVCVTGGEPTIHPGLPAFLRKVKALGLQVKLDTNGVNPTMIRSVIEEGLVDFFAMDLKHTWERYAEVIGIDQPKVIQNCRETASIIQDSGVAYEFRTTVYPVLHDAKALLAIASTLKPGSRYALQAMRFEKTFAQGLVRGPSLELEIVASKMRERFPTLDVEVRG